LGGHGKDEKCDKISVGKSEGVYLKCIGVHGRILEWVLKEIG